MTASEKVRRAQESFLRFRTRCFWSYKKDVVIKEEDIQWVVEGLRKYGGKEGFLIAGELCR